MFGKETGPNGNLRDLGRRHPHVDCRKTVGGDTADRTLCHPDIGSLQVMLTLSSVITAAVIHRQGSGFITISPPHPGVYGAASEKPWLGEPFV